MGELNTDRWWVSTLLQLLPAAACAVCCAASLRYCLSSITPTPSQSTHTKTFTRAKPAGASPSKVVPTGLRRDPLQSVLRSRLSMGVRWSLPGRRSCGRDLSKWPFGQTKASGRTASALNLRRRWSAAEARLEGTELVGGLRPLVQTPLGRKGREATGPTRPILPSIAIVRFQACAFHTFRFPTSEACLESRLNARCLESWGLQ
jgi:hypothetical protein